MKISVYQLRTQMRPVSPLPMAWAILLAAMPASAGADSSVDPLLADWPPPAAVATRKVFARLDQLEIDPLLLTQKLREGLAKQIPPERLASALERIGDNLAWLATEWAGCSRAKDRALRNAVLRIGNELLLGRVLRTALAPALRDACSGAQPDQRLSAAADLYAHLAGQLNAPEEAAWELAAALLTRDEPEAAVFSLVSTLHEIARRRGNLERPLAVASQRLRSGANLRTVRNELLDRFLRD